ncbi:hypothetical protein SRB5_38340 [Streptomyces sp. RB5]|uniref:Uncharacterized protein n=1 Tax=Streptomyces smaragdinus TaxID=2585196 RepID=A0A7K0CLQ0_9ACTN|nr:hypothetical protein [Streptomyces smaragdinus]MQY13684.1 hypothetical protein [Streptomyces smaragdinus]
MRPLLALCAALLTLPAAAPDPQEPPAGVLGRFQQVYERGQTAERQYAALSAELAVQQRRTAAADRALARARGELADGRRRAAVLAREQYRSGGGFSPYLRVLLARDPEDALERSAALVRVSEHQALILRELFLAERRVDRRASQARTALEKKRGTAERRRDRARQVKRELAAAEELLAELAPADVAAAEDALNGDGEPPAAEAPDDGKPPAEETPGGKAPADDAPQTPADSDARS